MKSLRSTSKINAWMEEHRIGDLLYKIRLFCKACGAEEVCTFLNWPEEAKAVAIKAVGKAFADKHRGCRHLRAVSAIPTAPGG